MKPIFLYGSLCDLALLEVVLGRAPDVSPATLDGFAAFWAAGETFPMIEARDGACATGLLLRIEDQTDIDRLDFYEGPFDYSLQTATVHSAEAQHEALVYLPTPGRYTAGASWDVADWTARHGALQTCAAHEIMSRFGVLSAQEVARRTPVILARAQQQLNGRASTTPRRLRHKSDADRVSLTGQFVDHDRFFLTEDLVVTHPKYDGGHSAERRRVRAVGAV